jgi:hypothetical protein
MLDSYVFGLAEANAIALSDLNHDCPALAAAVESYVNHEQAEEAAHAAF